MAVPQSANVGVSIAVSTAICTEDSERPACIAPLPTGKRYRDEWLSKFSVRRSPTASFAGREKGAQFRAIATLQPLCATYKNASSMNHSVDLWPLSPLSTSQHSIRSVEWPAKCRYRSALHRLGAKFSTMFLLAPNGQCRFASAHSSFAIDVILDSSVLTKIQSDTHVKLLAIRTRCPATTWLMVRA